MSTDANMPDTNETVKVVDGKSDKIKSIPPLEAAAHRLERLLGGGSKADNDRALDFYTNPVKVVRRWLGTSSGAAIGVTVDDIKDAAFKLLDPAGPCAIGRSLIVAEYDPPVAMDSDDDKPTSSYVSQASAREVESWLISLALRLLWKQGKFTEAFDVAEKGIAIILSHLEEASLRITSSAVGSASSLFPLLARIFRLRSLVAESINSPSIDMKMRADMAKSHSMATLRRDVDSQATLLNCMLRDLLRHSQGTYSSF